MEDLFDKDITVINKYFDRTTRQTKYKLSYVKGFWSSSDGVSINGTQLVKADGLIAKILINDSRNKTYQKPGDFKSNQKTWTLQNDDYLIKGKVVNFTTITKVLEDYKEAMKITKIATKDYGSEDMWHWAITGE